MSRVAPPSSAGAAASSTKALRKYKLVFIGDQAVGKTSIISSFMYGTFDSHYASTIGIDFVSKSVPVDDGTVRAAGRAGVGAQCVSRAPEPARLASPSPVPPPAPLMLAVQFPPRAGAAAAMGHGGAGALPLADPLLYPRLARRGRRLRHHQPRVV